MFTTLKGLRQHVHAALGFVGSFNVRGTRIAIVNRIEEVAEDEDEMQFTEHNSPAAFPCADFVLLFPLASSHASIVLS
jgi:hypothetical protein